MGRPVYRFCKSCGWEAKESTQREDHMEKVHGLKGVELEAMILIPRLYWSKEPKATLSQ